MSTTQACTYAYVCLGSNMGDTKANLAQAAEALNTQQGLQVVAASTLYYTEPQGIKEQEWFCNQVLRVRCTPTWSAQTFLQCLLAIEKNMGRLRSVDPTLRFGPRCIDMDLLFFGRETLEDTQCTVPHPRIQERAFVLIPLRDVLQQDTLFTLQDIEQALGNITYTLQGTTIYQ